MAHESSTHGESDRVRVVIQGGGYCLPIYVAQQLELFARERLNVEVTVVGPTHELVMRVVEGTGDIAYGSSDLVVQYVEQGADLVIFIGINRGNLGFYANPRVRQWEALRGKRVGVAPLTAAYTPATKAMLKAHGVQEDEVEWCSIGHTDLRYAALLKGDIDATILTPPHTVLARRAGYRHLGEAADSLGDYQGSAGFTTRQWAREHSRALVSYIRANIKALDWLFQERNHDQAAQILAETTQVPLDIAREALVELVRSPSGFLPKARLTEAGMRRVLELHQWAAEPQDPSAREVSRYYDSSYYQQALRGA